MCKSAIWTHFYTETANEKVLRNNWRKVLCFEKKAVPLQSENFLSKTINNVAKKRIPFDP